MRTPEGRWCPYYYVERTRWRESSPVCRLLEGQAVSLWDDSLCARCPVPDIRRANACPYMHLQLRIRKPLFGHRRVEVRAFCERGGEVKDPFVGCGQCHSPLEFIVAEE